MSSERPSVLVVDDSALVRQVIADLLEESGEYRVAGVAEDGMDAIRKVHALAPDLVTLDIQMPELDGLQALGYIMSEAPRPVVVLSALDAPRGGDLTIRALELGAVDFVRKPGREDELDRFVLRERLLRALRAACNVNLNAASVLARPLYAARRASVERVPASFVVAIAASTGGPRALAEIVPRLPPDLGAAVLVVQHMPAGFTESLSRRLDRLATLPVSEAQAGEIVMTNHVYVAPGGRDLAIERVASRLQLDVTDGTAEGGVRPSADRLFRSVAQHLGRQAVGVVLTGMGRDGSAGLRAMREAGAYGIVQDRGSATVFGMPLMALEHAGADRVAALRDVADAIATGLRSRMARRGRVTPTASSLS